MEDRAKVADLEGGLLDYWVARALDAWTWANQFHPTMTLDSTFSGVEFGGFPRGLYGTMEPTAILIPRNPFRQDRQAFCPSTDWSVGGWIIERERVNLVCTLNVPTVWQADAWRTVATKDDSTYATCDGPTPLVAAMRAVVLAKFGEYVLDHPTPSGVSA